jgi:hypothetical protein
MTKLLQCGKVFVQLLPHMQQWVWGENSTQI